MSERLPTGLVFNFPSPFFSLAFDFLRLAFNLISTPLGPQLLIVSRLPYLLLGFANFLLAPSFPFILGPVWQFLPPTLTDLDSVTELLLNHDLEKDQKQLSK
jgi:hypothetical protein